jgi:excisionase family DNA binding protein
MESTPTPLEPLLNIEQVSALLGICTKTVRRHIDDRELPAIRVGSRVMVDPADLRTYKAGRRTVAAGAPVGAAGSDQLPVAQEGRRVRVNRS